MLVGFVLDDTLDVSDGVQQAVLTTGAEMTRRGHDVHYIVAESASQDNLQIHSIAQFLKVKFNGNSVRTPRPAAKSKIKSLFNEINFDVLYVQMPFSPFLSGRVIAEAPKSTKIFGTFHILPYSSASSRSTKILGSIVKKSLKRFDGFFAVSEPARKFMNTAFSVDGKVIPNPIDYNSYHKANSLVRKKHNTSIVYVGRFDERKGVLQLIEAIALLPKKIRDTTDIIMCGKGPLHEKAIALAAEKNIHIHFPGFVTKKDKIKYLSQATIAVFPSISGESFGIVLAEAMSAGADITIGGKNPGYASVLGSWPETLFDGNNPTEIAQNLEKFLSNETLRIKIGKQQHAHVRAYDVVKVVDQLEHEYTCSLDVKER